MKYRSEIDGLRALAVLSVIFFHAGFALFSGGFVGVDVFFVISGFLITSIIMSDLEKGKFSILDFYERRIRRILPALYCILFVTIPFGWFFMLPDPLENFGQSIVATTLFSNNILSMLTAGYWDMAVEFKPLVHTWSLAVEEQFYVFFPILLIVIFRFKRKVKLILILLALISLCMAEWGWRYAPIANFYLLPFRAWELLIGAVCAFVNVSNFNTHHKNRLSLLGLIMILASIFAFDKTTPFPSIYGLLPVVGTALIILFSRNGGFVKRVLSLKILVGIGLVSYSAYLWHQPVFSFLRIIAKSEPNTLQYLILIILTFALSTLTYKFVETPFRNKQFLTRWKLFGLTFISSFLLVGIGAMFHIKHGYISRLYPDTTIENSDLYIAYNAKAFQYKKNSFPMDGDVRVLVLGNSFGRDFTNMMLENLPTDRIDIVYRDDFYDCPDQNPVSYRQGLVDQATVVVFASGVVAETCIEESIRELEAANKNVFYVGTKHFGYNLNWLMLLPRNKLSMQTNALMEETITTDNMLREAIPHKNYIDIIDSISKRKNTVFITDEGGHFISGDRSHLTKFGAKFVGRRALDDPDFLRALNLPENYLKLME